MANSSSSMQSDQYIAELLNIMRDQGRKDNPVTLQIGVMQSKDSVKIDDLVLNAEDLYIADHLQAGYEYPVVTPYVTGVTFGGGTAECNTTDKAVRSAGLKKGDLVAVQKLHNTNKFVILEKVVEAR